MEYFCGFLPALMRDTNDERTYVVGYIVDYIVGYMVSQVSRIPYMGQVSRIPYMGYMVSQVSRIP